MSPAALLPTLNSNIQHTPQKAHTKPPLAPQVIGPETKKATKPTRQLPKSLIENARLPPSEKRPFDPETHLMYQPPIKIHTMAELGLEGAGISPHAISEPFPLFTQDAIRQMRGEIFSEPVLKDCQYASTFCTNMIRGFGYHRAPFIFDTFKSPEVLSKISEVAGIDLIPVFDREITHINIAVKDDPIEGEEVQKDNGAAAPDADSTSNPVVKPAEEDDPPAFAWHYDSFPFVCVTMLSDCSDMVGGETAIKTPSGGIKKVRGPAQGYAVVMQGRYLEHQALKALGGRERISMVCPFRPRDPLVRDETVLATVRGISNWDELYPQYFEYRLDVLEERFRAQKKEEREREKALRRFDVEEKRAWLEEQREYIESMLQEMYVVE